MDPVTAVGLASAIISFVPLCVKLLQSAREIRDSLDGSVEKNLTRKAIVDEMKALSRRLKSADQARFLPEQRGLYDLALKCHELSQKILYLLDKIRPKSKSSFENYRSAYRAWSCESEIKNLEKQLNDCRSQLALGIVDLSSQDSAVYSKRILAMAQTDASRLEELQRHIEALRSGVQVEQIGTEACTQLRRLLGLQDDALAAIYQNRILESIKFENMHERDDRVHYPHEKTFNWLVEDDETPENEATGMSKSETLDMHEMKSKSRELFMNWLSSSEGIFHISGKLGSGKSTLMKLVCTRGQTRLELEKWAGNRSLLITQFFFWKPGTEMQKSLDGLYRSLLYDILHAFPELIKNVLPNIWKEVETSPWQIQTKFDLPIDVVKSALEQIIFNSESCAPRVCFCFFIDGIDEYDESHSRDHIYLVRLLRHWVKDSEGRLKMVVSSRDYNVFLNGFSADYRLQLHELTWFDMRQYVQDSLSHLPNSTLKEHLLKTIPRKACGIFLWIVLVVNEIRKKVEDDVTQDQLLQLLDGLPPGLEALFEHILNRLDENNRRTAYQIMALLRTANDNYLTLSLMEFSFLEDYHRDSELSIRDEFMSRYATDSDVSRTPEIYSKRLRGCCGGLVECYPSKPNYYGPWGVLSFTHRSIPDMLERPKIKAEMQSYLKDFSSVEALSHLIFAAAQFMKKDKTQAKGSCAGVTWMRLESRIDKPPYRFLQCVSSWVGDPFDVKPEPSRLLLHQGIQVYGNHGRRILVRYGAITRRETFSMLCQAALIGHLEYVEWSYRNNLRAIDKPWKRALVGNALLDTYLRVGLPIQSLSYFFKGPFLSLERTPFEANNLLPDGSPPATPPVGPRSSVACSYALSDEHTVWERFLVSCFLGWAGMAYPFHNDRFGLAVQQFLLHGAPSEFHIVIEPIRSPTQVTFHFPKPKNPFTVACEKNRFTIEFLIENSTGWNECDGKLSLSLLRWIRSVNPKNKAAITEILETAKECAPRSKELESAHLVVDEIAPRVTEHTDMTRPSFCCHMLLCKVFPVLVMVLGLYVGWKSRDQRREYQKAGFALPCYG
ncbi:hypothetical protein BFJ66_g5092 [Fusarium oxysporum f. sp. cepae]|uniref:NACHT domain-containing protein n=1 Tax=Fusarium oxysporum f. sp. cepae TaxID=396571 RepID=A0A3L6MYM1_FUSOX|nr:hypothetical protein BFJ65_g16129 [Fusarium oxysporum f. sp. cepae]RKK53372.1 hypothetical protein BFJ66_g5092 [Fusarium oxysporum f. sp. cepae]RKK54591.1 hypothetical protein BFJ67_g4677 [Fusarium oxysporum f. sp. cepae]